MTGRLHRVHHGVYAVGRSQLSPHGHCRAAVGTCGPDALLSHTSAAWLWGLLPVLRKPIEVSVPRRGRPRTGIKVHHKLSLAPEDRAEQAGIPVTTIPRTFLDLASSGATRLLQQSVERAERLGRLDLVDVGALLRRRAGTPGTRCLREALGIYRDPAFSRARSELLFLDLVRRPGYPDRL